MKKLSLFLCLNLFVFFPLYAQTDSTLDQPAYIGKFAAPKIGYGNFVTGLNRYNTGPNAQALPYRMYLSLWVGAKDIEGNVYVTNGDGNYIPKGQPGSEFNFRSEFAPSEKGYAQKDNLTAA